MDEFVCNKLTEWGLSKWIQNFKDEEVDKDNFYTLGDREIENLITKMGPRGKFKEKLKLLKAGQQTTHPETAISSPRKHVEGADSAQVWPSSRKQDKRKRKFNLQGESSKSQSPASKRRCDKKPMSTSATILSEVKNTMDNVTNKLSNEDAMFIKFLKTKICNLKTKKREQVGVFGKTGAGKSSLINAIIEEEDLLPTGSVSACTSVMIKVEANMHSSKYQAEIEFITKEDWRDEVWSYYIHKNDSDQEEENYTDDDDSDDDDIVEKLSALYGKEWETMSLEKLMEDRHFSGIPQFLKGKNIVLEEESAKKLSELFVKYTRSDSGEEEGKAVKRWYWPLVKCVTLRVPDNHLLQHVTIVDLPGNGDCNKSRDKMWKEIVGSCSTVWIVAEMNRPGSEKEAWEILKNASSLIGNGGECQRIHFICTKSDLIAKNKSAACAWEIISKRNEAARKKVGNKIEEVWKKQNLDIPFDISTVSSDEFLHRNCLTPRQTEIPKLQKVLEDLNDPHPVALNYVSGAYGILSLIQGARCREVAEKKTEVCRELEESMRRELDEVRKPMEEAFKAFERCLTEGVEQSKSRWEAKLKPILKPRGTGQGYWKMLKCAVKNNGAYKNKKKQINITKLLSSWLIDSIDREFMKTFPSQQKQGPFSGAINAFSLDTERLIKTFKEVELHLGFLKSEEENVKIDINSLIRKRKKEIYSSLTKSVEADMQECYEKAAKCSGTGTLENMKSIIERHVHNSKDTMFERAKDEMLTQLNALKEDVLKELGKTLQESIEQSLKTDDFSVPDVSEELGEVKSQHSKLKQQTT